MILKPLLQNNNNNRVYVVLILHSGIISRDISLFKRHFYSYILVIPGVTVQHIFLIDMGNQAFSH